MLQALEGEDGPEQVAEPQDKLACLRALERKVLWLSTWIDPQRQPSPAEPGRGSRSAGTRHRAPRW